MHYHWGETAAKDMQPLWTVQSSLTLAVVGSNDNHVVYIAASESCELKRFVGTNWKKVYLRTKTRSIPLLQPEYGFCQQNEPERGQVKDWYPNEKE